MKGKKNGSNRSKKAVKNRASHVQQRRKNINSRRRRAQRGKRSGA